MIGILYFSTITPIFKQGDREDVANYRPIFILPYFSKLLEKVMYVSIVMFLKWISYILLSLVLDRATPLQWHF